MGKTADKFYLGIMSSKGEKNPRRYLYRLCLRIMGLFELSTYSQALRLLRFINIYLLLLSWVCTKQNSKDKT